MIPSATPAADSRTSSVNNVRPHPAGGAVRSPVAAFAGQCGAGLARRQSAVRAAALIAPPVILAQPQNAPRSKARPPHSPSMQLVRRSRTSGAAMAFRSPVLRSASYTTPALTIAADNGTTYSVVITNCSWHGHQFGRDAFSYGAAASTARRVHHRRPAVVVAAVRCRSGNCYCSALCRWLRAFALAIAQSNFASSAVSAYPARLPRACVSASAVV